MHSKKARKKSSKSELNKVKGIERTLVITIISCMLIGILVLVCPLCRNLVQGVIQGIYAGNSIGKTLTVLAYFLVFSSASLFLLKARLARLLEKDWMEKVFGIGFLLLFFAGFVGGVIQLYYVKGFFDSGLPMASMTQDSQGIGWEASSESHTHFPKTAIYFAEKVLPFNIPFKVDNGYPFYSVLPNVDYWSAFYLLCLFLGCGLALLYINSRIRKTSSLDYLLFLAGSFGIGSSIIDGGLADATLVISLYLGLLFYFRNYKNIGVLRESFYPLAALCLALFAWPLGLNLNVVSYALPVLCLISTGYYLVKSRKEKSLNFNGLNAFIGIVFIVSLVSSTGYYLFYSFGKRMSGEMNLYVYGLPPDSSAEEVKSIIGEYALVESIDKKGWIAFAKVNAENAFRAQRLEQELQEKLEPESYLFVEGFKDKQRFAVLRVHWFKQVSFEEFLDQEFLDCRTVFSRHNPENNTTDLVLETRTTEAWAMLSVLTDIRANGWKDKLLVSNPEDKPF